MRKISIGIVVGILAITALILMSGTVSANSTTNDTTNATPTTTGTVAANGTVTTTVTATVTEAPAPKETGQDVTPEKTIKPKPTESPGFGSIMAIVTMLSAIYIFRTKRK